MKNNLFLVLMLILINSTNAQQQVKDSINIKEPEYSGKVLFVKDSITSILIEKKEKATNTKTSTSLILTGVGKISTIDVVKNAFSSTRIKKAKSITFIVSVLDNTIDPTEVIKIFKFKQKIKRKKEKSYRYIELNSSGIFSYDVTDSDQNLFEFSAEKYGEKSFIITINNLEIGEYGISIKGFYTTYNLFGIDK